MAYCCVRFLDGSGTEVIPYSWVEHVYKDGEEKTFASFPPKEKYPMFRKYLREMTPANSLWESFEIEIIYKAGTYKA